MQCFVEAARARAIEPFQALFHKDAVIFGAEKGGCIDWPIGLQFEFHLHAAQIIAQPPYSFVIANWTKQPLVLGGEVVQGNATIVLFLEPGEKQGSYKMLCVHAHFSKREEK